MKLPGDSVGILRGILVAFLLNMMAFLTFASLFPLLIPAIGIIQILYILPYIYRLKKYGESAIIKGAIIGAAIVAAINICGWLVLLIGYR